MKLVDTPTQVPSGIPFGAIWRSRSFNSYQIFHDLGDADCISPRHGHQPTPPPSRTVYKCEVGGKVHYSDSPCVGAQKVDVTPTRGLNKSTGRELTGSDVRREVFREQLSDAVRPITGMNAQQLDQAGRRMKLSSEAQVACLQLDQALPLAEQAAQGASALKAQQLELFKLRKRYRELG